MEVKAMKTRLIENKERHGIELYFEYYPFAASRNILKGAGFRWHNMKKCWYAVETPERREVAEKVLKRENGHKIPEPVKAAEPEKVVEVVKAEPAAEPEKIPEVVEPEEPEKVSSLGVKVEKVKKGKRTEVQRAFDYIVKLAPGHMKNGAPDQWNGKAGSITIACDGHQILLTSDNIETDIVTSEERINRMKKDFFIKTSEEAVNRAELDFTTKELKAAIAQLKKGKRKAQVVYTFENGLTLNADYLYNMMLATGQTTLFYKDLKSPVYMDNGENTSYILLPINNKNGADKKGLYVINQ
jgi:hypothetical protein